ncbi:MAG: putative toxin-antitoxin system toxin component, PIN family [Gammaproteobacteria bacterium]
MKVKAVIDTNVLISSVLSPGGNPAKVVRFFVECNGIVFSKETYEEFSTRLWRSKFDPYISREMRQAILLDFSNIATWLTPDIALNLCRDINDNKFLELAVSAQVDMLVSGDSDLTVLNNIKDIPIYTPSQCLKYLAI